MVNESFLKTIITNVKIPAYCVAVTLSTALIPVDNAPSLAPQTLLRPFPRSFSHDPGLQSLPCFPLPLGNVDFMLHQEATAVTQAPEANVIRDHNRPQRSSTLLVWNPVGLLPAESQDQVYENKKHILSPLLIFLSWFLFETEFCTGKANLELLIFLPLSPRYGNYGCVPLHFPGTHISKPDRTFSFT